MKHDLLILTLIFGLLPSFTTKAEEFLDLSGAWTIRIDAKDVGLAKGWQGEAQGVVATLPGIVTEAGLGDELALKPALTKQVFEHLHQKRSYIGAAWFYKEIEIESVGRLENATLYLERVLWTSRAWVNGEELGSQNSLCIPHKYDCSHKLRPGKNLIAIRVDNRSHVNLGTYGHAYTQQTQTIWNGIIGRIEIQPRETVSISDIHITPQRNLRGEIEVSLSIQNLTNRSVKKPVLVEIREQGRTPVVSRVRKNYWIQPGENRYVVMLDGKTLRPWSEFSPSLYQISCQVSGTKKTLTTGFRTIETSGTELRINNRPSFMRGTLDCCIFPKTGYPPTDTKHWQKIFATLKEHGLNHVRFHSWCPPEAAFVAADKLGIYLQPELPNWTAKMGQDPAVDGFLEKEGERILGEYSHHPSFVFFSLGNELTGNLEFLDKMILKLRSHAPHLLYTSTSYSFSKRGLLPGPEDDFFISQKTKSGWVRGQGFLNDVVPNTDRDYSKGLESVHIPLITHEVGQYCVFPDLTELPKYDGNLAALNFQAIRQDLEDKGRLDRAKHLTAASGKLAAILYKEDIERALRTPGLSGIQLLGMQDFSGQSTATVGVLDAFWDSKGVVSSSEFRQFCAPVVPLLKTKKRVWTNEDTFFATIEVANFGQAKINNQFFEIEIVDANKQTVYQQKFVANVPLGNGHQVGEIRFPLDEIKNASKLSVRCKLLDTAIENSWEVWCYPAKTPTLDRKVRQFVVHRDVDDEFISDIATGQRILLLAEREIIREPLDGRFVPVFWSPLHFPNQPGALGTLIQSKHPAFEHFPTDSHTNWQWWEMLSKSTSLNATSMGSNFDPIVSFVDKYNRNATSACVSEFKIGSSRVLVCTLDIDSAPQERIAAAQFKKSLHAYMNSPAFHPSFECTLDQFSKLFCERGEKLVVSAADGNLADRLSTKPYYWSGTRQKIENHTTKSLDTKLVWEDAKTNLGYVCDVAVEKDMVYTAKFRLGQFGSNGYQAQPIRLYIKARKDVGQWVEAVRLEITDMHLAKGNQPGEYNEYNLSLVANERPDLIGFDEMLLQIEELSTRTQGYVGALSFDAVEEEK